MARYQLLIVLAAALGSKVIDTKAMKAEESVLTNLAKEVEDNSRYKIMEANATVLKLLVGDKDGVSRTEVFDMLHSRDEDDQHMDLPTFPEDAEDAKADVPAIPDSQTELLQAADDKVRKDLIRKPYTSPRGEPAGAAAGIMVVITCTIVCVAYAALIIWRRIYLQLRIPGEVRFHLRPYHNLKIRKRNGLKHELLRNEEMIAETRIEL